MVKETTEDATINFIPLNDLHIWFYISMVRKNPRFTNFYNKHIQTSFSEFVFDLCTSVEERATPVLEASVTNHCAAHTRSIHGLKWKMEGRTFLSRCGYQ
jgi:hypothetical protein